MPKLRSAITTNADEVSRAFLFLKRDQVPFATAVALTRVAQQARLAVQAQMGQTFKLRNPRVVKGVRINAAKKRDRPIRSEVGILDQFMADHALGVIRKATKARRLAIPTKFAASKRTRGGKIRASMKPRRVLSRKGARVEGEGNRATILRGRGRGGGGKLLRMFLLRSRVKIAKSWPFQQQVLRKAQANYGAEFVGALADAVRTARTKHIRTRRRRP